MQLYYTQNATPNWMLSWLVHDWLLAATFADSLDQVQYCKGKIRHDVAVTAVSDCSCRCS